MIKFFYHACLLIVVVAMNTAWCACQQTVDSKKIILFLDFNASRSEVLATEQAACERGQRLVVLPERHQQVGELYERINNLYYMIQDYRCEIINEVHIPECPKIIQEHRELNAILDRELKRPGAYIDADILKAQLWQLRQQGASIEALVLSGHHTQHFYGRTGSLHPEQMMELFKQLDFAPELLELYLWGCYSTTYSKLDSWRKAFPKTRFMIGFYASAPASVMSASGEMLKSALVLGPSLREARNQASVQSLMNAIPHSQMTFTSAYVGADQAYYVKQGKVGPYDPADCIPAREQLPQQRAVWEQYYQGQLPVPHDTQNSPLRSFYGYLKEKWQCFKAEDKMPAPDQVINLIYYTKAKQNFARHHFLLNTMVSSSLQVANWNLLAAQLMGPLKQDLDRLGFWLPNQKNLIQKNRREVLENTQKLEQVLRKYPRPNSGFDLYAPARALLESLKKYLGELKCINGWHEFEAQGVTPAPSC